MCFSRSAVKNAKWETEKEKITTRVSPSAVNAERYVNCMRPPCLLIKLLDCVVSTTASSQF